MKQTVWVGFDPRETSAFAVAIESMKKHITRPLEIHGLVLRDLEKRGLYKRPHKKEDGQLYDLLSDAPMSTEFANSRFLVPHLAQTGWALFMDCDMLVRGNIIRLFEEVANDKYAVMCVKHKHNPTAMHKMDKQVQTRYSRKNWSSVCLFNCDHPANKALTLDVVNTWPGRDLHAFKWLDDSEIGEMPPKYNYLVGHTKLPDGVEPFIVHHTDGVPFMDGYEDVEYADEWWNTLTNWAL